MRRQTVATLLTIPLPLLISPVPVLQSALSAQTRVDLLFTGVHLGYAGSETKKDGDVLTAYTYFGQGLSHVLEGTGSFTRIDYRNGSRLEQVDVSAAYLHYFSTSLIRVGGHLIESTDPLTDGGKVLFGSVGLYAPYRWSAGVETAVSRYSAYRDSLAWGSGLTVTQVSPSAGFTWGDGSGYRFLYATIQGYFIRLSRDVGLEDRSFYSMEATLSYTHGSATFGGFAWHGQQIFAVRQGGFTAYNLPELHTGGYGGSLRYVLTPKSAVTLGVYSERFRDIGFTNDVAATILLLSLGFTL
jgi:hypothetical protein